MQRIITMAILISVATGTRLSHKSKSLRQGHSIILDQRVTGSREDHVCAMMQCKASDYICRKGDYAGGDKAAEYVKGSWIGGGFGYALPHKEFLKKSKEELLKFLECDPQGGRTRACMDPSQCKPNLKKRIEQEKEHMTKDLKTIEKSIAALAKEKDSLANEVEKRVTRAYELSDISELLKMTAEPKTSQKVPVFRVTIEKVVVDEARFKEKTAAGTDTEVKKTGTVTFKLHKGGKLGSELINVQGEVDFEASASASGETDFKNMRASAQMSFIMKASAKAAAKLGPLKVEGEVEAVIKGDAGFVFDPKKGDMSLDVSGFAGVKATGKASLGGWFTVEGGVHAGVGGALHAGIKDGVATFRIGAVLGVGADITFQINGKKIAADVKKAAVRVWNWITRKPQPPPPKNIPGVQYETGCNADSDCNSVKPLCCHCTGPHCMHKSKLVNGENEGKHWGPNTFCDYHVGNPTCTCDTRKVRDDPRNQKHLQNFLKEYKMDENTMYAKLQKKFKVTEDGVAEDDAYIRCHDLNTQCAAWAGRGECDKNPKFMHTKCQRSCGKCGGQEITVMKRLPMKFHECSRKTDGFISESSSRTGKGTGTRAACLEKCEETPNCNFVAWAEKIASKTDTYCRLFQNCAAVRDKKKFYFRIFQKARYPRTLQGGEDEEEVPKKDEEQVQ